MRKTVFTGALETESLSSRITGTMSDGWQTVDSGCPTSSLLSHSRTLLQEGDRYRNSPLSERTWTMSSAFSSSILSHDCLCQSDATPLGLNCCRRVDTSSIPRVWPFSGSHWVEFGGVQMYCGMALLL